MTIINVNNKIYTVPTSWNELSQQQLLAIMECLFISRYVEEQALLKLLKILCNMTYWEFFNTPVTACIKRKGLLGRKVEVTGLDEFIYLTDFLLEERTMLTKQLMPEYKGLYGPDDSFGNLIMKELVLSEYYYLAWWNDKERIDLLNELCAVLYRPAKKNYDFEKNPDGDPRIEVNQNLCSFFAKSLVAHWPLTAKLAVATWYDGCRSEMQENNDEVFGGEGGEVAKYGLVSVIRRVAKEGAFGNFDDVENKMVNLVMIDINESIAEAKALEKQSKNIT